MKNIFKFNFILLLGLAVITFTSCGEELSEINIDPNNPVDVPASNLLTQAEYELNNLLWSRGYNGEWTMLLVQHWAQNEYAEESRYTVDGNDFNGEWTTMYASVLNELKIASEMIAEDEGLSAARKANQLAIIDILKAHAYQNLVDGYGDIPFSQALNSIDFPLPSYDNQQEVYNGLFTMLENAINAFDESQPSFDSGDIIYNGDVASWKKLGNSLLMRLAMRIVDVDNGTAANYLNKAAGNAFTSNADNALFVFSDNPDLANPLFIDNVINNRDDFAVTDVLVDNLTAMGDPRLQMFANLTLTGDIVGMPYGLTDGEAFALKSTTSRPSDMVRSAQAPAVIMDYAEVQFILAEAYQRGILTGDAAAAYAEGVKASMNYWGIDDDAAISAYVDANPYDANNWKESLGWQKWIAFYMNGPQAWAEWRRLDYPQLDVPVAATNTIIPVRLPYPIDEQTRNNTSLSAVTSNPNDLNSKLFWDVN